MVDAMTEKVCRMHGEKPPNQDVETGIHYGVVSSHALNEWALSDIYDNGTALAQEDWRSAMEQTIPVLVQCVKDRGDKRDYPEDIRAFLRGLQKMAEEQDLYLSGDSLDRIWYEADSKTVEEITEGVIQAEIDGLDFQETTYRYDDGSVVLELHPDNDIFVTKSPVFTMCRECSPCAPNAGYLADQPGPLRAYCLDKEWFEDGKCPYKYWSVETGELLYSPEGEEHED